MGLLSPDRYGLIPHGRRYTRNNWNGSRNIGLLIAFMPYKKVDSIEIEDKTVATITGRIQMAQWPPYG